MPSKRHGPPTFWITYEGPIFKEDPAKTAARNITAFVVELTHEAHLAARAKAPYRTGELFAHLNARMTGRSGRPWKTVGVVSTWGLGEEAWRNGPFRGWFNYSGKMERRYHFLRAGRRVLLDAKRYHRDLAKGLN